MSGEIAIIGAGLGGLTLALALARTGRAVRVFEQVDELAEVGAGLTLSPNASRVLDHLGLGEEMRAMGYVPPHQWVQHWQTGEVLREHPRGDAMEERYGAPYLHVHRADLHLLLARRLLDIAPDALELGQRLVDVDRQGRTHFSSGLTIEADVVVGADGLHSALREALFPSVEPRFTGQVAWRGLLASDSLPPGAAGNTPGIHIGPQRLFLRYPVRAGTLLNYAAFVELEGWQEESWSIRSSAQELLGHFEGWDPLVRTIIAATPPDAMHKWALFTREPLDSWTAGRAVLLGDAAHAMLPFLGQGAGTAIEDAMVLARCLDAFDPDEALQRYETARRERTTMVQTQSRLLGMTFQGQDPTALGRGPLRNEETLGLFDYDAVNEPV